MASDAQKAAVARRFPHTRVILGYSQKDESGHELYHRLAEELRVRGAEVVQAWSVEDLLKENSRLYYDAIIMHESMQCEGKPCTAGEVAAKIRHERKYTGCFVVTGRPNVPDMLVTAEKHNLVLVESAFDPATGDKLGDLYAFLEQRSTERSSELRAIIDEWAGKYGKYWKITVAIWLLWSIGTNWDSITKVWATICYRPACHIKLVTQYGATPEPNRAVGVQGYVINIGKKPSAPLWIDRVRAVDDSARVFGLQGRMVPLLKPGAGHRFSFSMVPQAAGGIRADVVTVPIGTAGRATTTSVSVESGQTVSASE